MRAGRYIHQPTGYRAFVPAPLPPDPPIQMDAELTKLLSDADRALGRLDGVATMLPDPNLFVAMYVKHEAVLSSQIEGTQSTLGDVLQFEIDAKGDEQPKDIEEVVNYVKAINYGIDRLNTLPICVRLLKEIHAKLLENVRGAERQPGEFRDSQNWIGGSNPNNAVFVPPPPHDMQDAIGALEKFLHDRDSLPVLIHCGLAHAQFETIHPFLDGNGRIGRLLITLLLCERTVLQKPLLYLSYYLKAHRAQYYDRLQAVRQDGDWEGWLKFFLRGVFEVSQAATTTARDILQLREKHRQQIIDQTTTPNAPKLLDFLFQHPLVDSNMVADHLGVSKATAHNIIEVFEREKLLVEITGHKRNRKYRYDEYYRLFEQQALRLPTGEAVPPAMNTQSEAPPNNR